MNGDILGPPFPVIHDRLLILSSLRERFLSWHHTAYHRCAVNKLNDGVGVVRCHAVVGQQGVQGARTSERPHVQGQRGGCVVAYPYHLRAAHHEVQDPVAEGGVQSQGP